MRPPECRVCRGDLDPFGEDCGLVYFKKRPSDEEWDKRREEKGFVGHPPYADWFCTVHYAKAVEFSNLPIDQAMQKVRAFFGDDT